MEGKSHGAIDLLILLIVEKNLVSQQCSECHCGKSVGAHMHSVCKMQI